MEPRELAYSFCDPCNEIDPDEQEEIDMLRDHFDDMEVDELLEDIPQ